jgi:hypothetical protein
MSKELPQDFKCLVLFAALSGRTFTKTQLGLSKMKVKQLDALNAEHGLLAITGKGNSRTLQANSETLRWADEHFYTPLPDKTNQAVRMVLDLVRAKTAAYLAAKQISFAQFVNPAKLEVQDDIDQVRKAYLAITAGSYKVRVLLKDLRKRLPFDREKQDAAFSKLIERGEADFYPEDDPALLDEEDERVAFQIADRRRHVVYLHPEQRT